MTTTRVPARRPAGGGAKRYCPGEAEPQPCLLAILRRSLASVVASILLAAPAHAQQPAPPPIVTAQYVDERTGLGLDEAIARALETEPSIRGSRTDITAARGRLEQAALRPNPAVTFERRTEPAGTDDQFSIGVEWPLDLFRRRGRIESAQGEAEVAELAVADRERLLAAAVRMQYGLAAAAVRDLVVATEVVATADSQWTTVRARVDEGATPPIERDLLEVELRRLQAERSLAAGRADAAMVQLKQLLGLPPDAPLLLRSTIETLVTADPQPVRTEPDVRTRADVREAEARIALADARADQARREGRVDVNVFGSYMRIDAGFPQLGVGSSGAFERVRGRFNNVAAGASVVVPVLNRNQGLVAAALAERSGFEHRRLAAELAARTEVAVARARDVHARQAVDLFTSGVLKLARQNLDVVRQTFDLGRATVFDVLTEQRRYLDIEQAYASALREAWEARTDLKRALGEIR